MRNDITAIDVDPFMAINELIGDLVLPEKIGLLSIDLDGNDFWILEAIKVIDPINGRNRVEQRLYDVFQYLTISLLIEWMPTTLAFTGRASMKAF